MTRLKEITKDSWLVDGDGDLGILTKHLNKYVLSTNNIKKKFNSKEELSKFFKEDLFSTAEKMKSSAHDFYMDGFPINYDSPFLVEDNKTDLPLFAKNHRVKVHYCAGYYCVKLAKWWTVKYCMKKSKLDKYPVKGPFKSEAEANIELTRLRSEDEGKESQKSS